MIFKRQFGIRLKITLVFGVVFIALSFAFNLYSYRQIKALLIDDNNRYLLTRAATLLDKTEISPVIIPLPDQNSAIRVVNTSGDKNTLVFQSPGVIKNIRTPQITGVTDTLDMRVAYVINNNDDNTAGLMLVTSAAQLNQNLRYLWLTLFACSMLSALVAGLVAYIMASYLLMPIQRIINAAKKINTNKLRDTLPASNTNDELQELTETINSMLIRIDQSLQQQQNFFASASHELKTPLAVLKAELEVGLKKDGISTEISNLLNSQLIEINRLQQVVQEFLLVSQLKSGGLSLYKEPLDIADLILKIFNRVNPLLKQKSLRVAIHFDQETESFMISADRDKLWIILMNVAENASKYGVNDTDIICKIGKSADVKFMQISITNTIAKQYVPTTKLQGAFYRENADQDGAGIGLWLCDQLIGMHGGNLNILSSGYRFEVVINLPLNG